MNLISIAEKSIDIQLKFQKVWSKSIDWYDKIQCFDHTCHVLGFKVVYIFSEMKRILIGRVFVNKVRKLKSFLYKKKREFPNAKFNS